MSQRVRELWRSLETILLLENVPAEEISAIRQVFLDSMAQTQVDLSEDQSELLGLLLSLLDEQGERLLSVSDIVDRQEELRGVNKGREDYHAWRKKSETRTSQLIRQLSLRDANDGKHKDGKRKDGKRAYRFSRARVLDVRERYQLDRDDDHRSPSTDPALTHLLPSSLEEVVNYKPSPDMD